jgi:hypothetical protein
MTLLAACLGGLSGACAVEISELYGAIRSVKGYPWKHPDEIPLGPYLVSVGLRLVLGMIAAALCAIAGPLGVLGAVAAGIAAPKLLEELGRHARAASVPALAAGLDAGVSELARSRPASAGERPGEGEPAGAPR